MTPRFVFHPGAREELREARDWYERQRVGLGAELGEAVDGELERIGEYPTRYPEVVAGLRRAVLRRFPYSLFYRVRSADIQILAVFHHKRDPRVWRRRATT
jgi:plasmid stabilization system protein ParE